MKAALRWGANINCQNAQGQTPLHYLFAYPIFHEKYKHSFAVNDRTLVCKHIKTAESTKQFTEIQERFDYNTDFGHKYEELAAYLISKGADDCVQNEHGYTCYNA